MHLHTHYFTRGLLLWLIPFLLLACSGPDPQLKQLSADAVILSFGDSLTYGTGAGRDQSYPAHLQKLIARKVINAGIPGEVSYNGLQRLPALLKQHRPALLILCHGGNDILRHHDLKETQNNLQQMINLAKTNNTQVVLVSVPQFSLFLKPAPFYQELAEINQLPIENEVLSSILKKNNLKSDQIHPNAEGYALMATSVYTLLKTSGAI